MECTELENSCISFLLTMITITYIITLKSHIPGWSSCLCQRNHSRCIPAAPLSRAELPVAEILSMKTNSHVYLIYYSRYFLTL